MNLSKSQVLKFRESPRSYKLRYIDGIKEETDAMIFGKMLHEYVLEPKLFWDRFCRAPEMPKGILRTADDYSTFLKANNLPVVGTKAKMKERMLENELAPVFFEDFMQAEIGDRVVLDGHKLEKLESSKKGVYDCPAAKTLIDNSEHEVLIESSLFGGCVGYMDGINVEKGIIFDLKKVLKADNHSFQREMHKKGFHIEGAIYCAMAQEVYGKPFRFAIIATEGVRPNHCNVFSINEPSLQAGMEIANYLVKNLKKCKENNRFPAYSDGVTMVDIPDWAMNEGVE